MLTGQVGRKHLPAIKCASAASALFLLAAAAGCQQMAPVLTVARWSLENAAVVFTRRSESGPDIFVRDLATGEERNLTQTAERENWPVPSPDGQWLVYQRWQDRNIDLWLMRRDGSEAHALVTGEGADYLPAWSPDGQQIVFTSWRKEAGDVEAAPHLYLVNCDGSGVRRLLADSLGGSNGATFAPDGRHLLYSRQTAGDSNNLYLLDLATLTSTALTSETGYAASAVFSPDGARVAYYLDDGRSANLVTMARDGSQRTVWPAAGKNWYPDWSPDGNWILVTRQPGSDDDLDLVAIPLKPGVGEVPIMAGPERVTEGRWLPAR